MFPALMSPLDSIFISPSPEVADSAAAARSGVVPFFSLLGGGGFLPASFLGVFGFFFFGRPGPPSSSPGRGRFGGAGLGVLAALSWGVLFRLACLPDRPRHLSRCCATLVTTKYRGQLGHFTVGNDTFSGADCLNEADASGVDGGLDPGVFDVVFCFFFFGLSLSVAKGFPWTSCPGLMIRGCF